MEIYYTLQIISSTNCLVTLQSSQGERSLSLSLQILMASAIASSLSRLSLLRLTTITTSPLTPTTFLTIKPKVPKKKKKKPFEPSTPLISNSPTFFLISIFSLALCSPRIAAVSFRHQWLQVPRSPHPTTPAYKLPPMKPPKTISCNKL